MKKAVPMQQLVNWYYSNYCTRKCYTEEQRQNEHIIKLQELAKRLQNIKMTHQDFLTMIRSDKTICDLSEQEWKERKFSLNNDHCIVCKKFGIR